MTTPTPPRPHTDANSHDVLTHAIRTLAMLRHHHPADTHELDPGHALHLLASLTEQAHDLLPTAIENAHRHGYTWTHIRMLLNR